MTTPDGAETQGRLPRPIIAAFPKTGRRIEHAYTELEIAAHGTSQQRNALGDLRTLARPWDPATCVDPHLRTEVWRWLDAVVAWLNHEYVWNPETMIPACWPRHPHLLHEVAVLADLRRRAGVALTADALEEWHRYALPAFHERLRRRLGASCQGAGHESWPALGRYTRSSGGDARRGRLSALLSDVDAQDSAFGIRPAIDDPCSLPDRVGLRVVEDRWS